MESTYPPPPPASYVPPPPSSQAPPPPALHPLPPAYYPPPPGHAPVYPTSPQPVAAKPAAGVSTVVPMEHEQLQGAAEQHVRRYFLVGMGLGLIIGLFAFLPLLFYESLQQSSRKRKYYISGVLAGICLSIVVIAAFATFWILFVLKATRDISASTAADGTFAL